MKYEILKSIRDAVIEEDCIWIITDYLNCLFKYDFRSQEIEAAAVFPDTMSCSFASFSQILKLENEIYFIPRMARSVFCYDIVKTKFYEVNIPFEGFQSDKKMDAIVYGKDIYCVNRYPDIVIKIDSMSKETEVFFPDKSNAVKEEMEGKVHKAYKAPCIFQKQLIWSNYNDTLTIFDIKTKAFSIEHLNGVMFGMVERLQKPLDRQVKDWIVGVRSFRERIWLFSFEGKVFLHDLGMHRTEFISMEQYKRYDDTDNIRELVIHDLAIVKGEVFFIPSYENQYIKYDCSTRQFEECMGESLRSWKNYRRSYTLCKVFNYNIWLYSYYENCFYILDTKKNVEHKKQLEICYKKLIMENPLFEDMMTKNKAYEFDDLDYLCDKVSAGDSKGKMEKDFSMVGKRILSKFITET